jgi:hypothetical protein
MASSRKTPKQKPTTKTTSGTKTQVYTDPFLQKNISLSPDPYQLYLEKQKRSLVPRSDYWPETNSTTTSNQTSATDSTPSSFNSSKTPNSQNTTQSTTEENLHKQNFNPEQSIFESFAQEKESFLYKDPFMQENIDLRGSGSQANYADHMSSSSTNPHSSNSYSNSHSPKPWWQPFTSGVVWNTIAITMLLAVVLFYFQGFQPFMLSKYVQQSQNQVNKLVNTYSQQVSDFSQTQQEITSNFGTYDPSILCQNEQTYTQAQTHNQQLNTLEVNLFAQSELANLENFYGFYHPQIQTLYNDLYQTYKSNLSAYEKDVSRLQQYVQILVYENQWIDTCGTIQQADRDLDTIQNTCTDLQTATQNLQTNEWYNELPATWRDSVTKGVTACQDLNSNTLDQFLTQWFNYYSSVRKYQPDLDTSNTKLEQLNQDLQTQADTTKTQMQKVYQNRNNLTEIWYFLPFDQKAI